MEQTENNFYTSDSNSTVRKGLRNGILLGVGAGALAGIIYPLAKKKEAGVVVAWGISGAIVGTSIFLGIVYYQETHS